jgi:hypothetical protein
VSKKRAETAPTPPTRPTLSYIVVNAQARMATAIRLYSGVAAQGRIRLWIR